MSVPTLWPTTRARDLTSVPIVCVSTDLLPVPTCTQGLSLTLWVTCIQQMTSMVSQALAPMSTLNHPTLVVNTGGAPQNVVLQVSTWRELNELRS